MCFWIFHDWKPVESWTHYVAWDRKALDMGDFTEKTAVTGFECRKCGRRKIKKSIGGVAARPYQDSLDWMKEEVLR